MATFFDFEGVRGKHDAVLSCIYDHMGALTKKPLQNYVSFV